MVCAQSKPVLTIMLEAKPGSLDRRTVTDGSGLLRMLGTELSGGVL